MRRSACAFTVQVVGEVERRGDIAAQQVLVIRG
jgi:hypothetical protein